MPLLPMYRSVTAVAAVLLGTSAVWAEAPSAGPQGPVDAAIRRGIGFLSREVPRWSREHDCFSCHNNGDAARALYTARRLGYEVPDEALAATSVWLAKPAGWADNGGDPAFQDPKVATVQFSWALREAILVEAAPRAALARAAELLVAEQDESGGWPVGTDGTLGSPATHGRMLATHASRQVLLQADPARFRDSIRRADEWLRRQGPRTILDASAAAIAFEAATDQRARAIREQSLALLLKTQNDDGGWGPYAVSASEVFDTAIAVLTLASDDRQPSKKSLSRGREFLIAEQLADGSWPETTRPPGAESYAQRLSTSAWATLALLATTTQDSR